MYQVDTFSLKVDKVEHFPVNLACTAPRRRIKKAGIAAGRVAAETPQAGVARWPNSTRIDCASTVGAALTVAASA